jgi:UDP-3-O-[3-hydroxymyristoyl] N-acetylglucosamine deacetylase
MGIDLHDYQTTLKSRVTLSGIGVHSGNPVSLHFVPADPDTGVIFSRIDGDGDPVELRALSSEVGGTDLCTILGNPAGVHVATVEHLLAALMSLGIDNVLIEIDGNEVPVLDGSAAMFVEAFDQAGIQQQPVKRRYIRIVKPVRIENGASWAEFRPYNGTRFEVEIDFESAAIGRQFYAADITPDVFRRDISRARTFGFMKDVERLWAAGYALGYSNEFVRHKMLDALGDLALAGARFIGCFRSYRGGHRMNAQALRRLLSDRSAFEIVETNRRERGRGAEMIAVNAPVYAPWMI